MSDILLPDRRIYAPPARPVPAVRRPFFRHPRLAPPSRHRPYCPLYGMATGDGYTLLDASGREVLAADGRGYVACCCQSYYRATYCTGSTASDYYLPTSGAGGVTSLPYYFSYLGKCLSIPSGASAVSAIPSGGTLVLKSDTTAIGSCSDGLCACGACTGGDGKIGVRYALTFSSVTPYTSCVDYTQSGDRHGGLLLSLNLSGTFVLTRASSADYVTNGFCSWSGGTNSGNVDLVQTCSPTGSTQHLTILQISLRKYPTQWQVEVNAAYVNGLGVLVSEPYLSLFSSIVSATSCNVTTLSNQLSPNGANRAMSSGGSCTLAVL